MVLGVVVVAGLATSLATLTGAAGALGDWLAAADPLLANLALVVLVVGPALVTVVAVARLRRNADDRRHLTHLSRRDPLTGLPNRAALPDLLRAGLRGRRRGSIHVACMFCDLDRFKLVNDTYGHEIGDQLMTKAAERIQDLAAPDGNAVRYGGDEFVVVVPVSGRAEAARLAARFVHQLEAPFEVENETMRISASIGVAINDDPNTTAESLLRDADVAMYQAKAEGPGAVRVFDQSMQTRLSRSTALERLRHAIARGELSLRYAPVLAVRSGELAGVRVELHWNDPLRGPVPPREFVPVLEETGLIVEVGAWTLAEACRHARRWRELAPERQAPQVIVPIAVRQLAQASFRDRLAEFLEQGGAERNQLCLAVGDIVAGHDITDAWTMLRHARALGVHVALDGAGGGRSPLSDLRHARFDQLCIDPTLVAGLDHNDDDAAIVEHLISLAHRLGLTTMASRVETASQLALLRKLGCDRAEGPFLGVPLRDAEVDALLDVTPVLAH